MHFKSPAGAVYIGYKVIYKNIVRIVKVEFDAERLFDEEGHAELCIRAAVEQSLAETFPDAGMTISDVQVEEIEGSFMSMNE